jgi:low affinity Fe/Cu permease
VAAHDEHADELIRASEGARRLVSLERLSDDELARLKGEFERLARSRLTGA